MEENKAIVTVGDVVVWIEQGTSIHIRAISPEGDPLELSGAEARQLASLLVRLAEDIGE